MKIGIIGAGFTGLSAAYYLQKLGHSVTVFERDLKPGGLAIGYREKGWNWSLEQHYHHWFTNDRHVLSLAEEIKHKVLIKKPLTSSFVENQIYQLDSPLSLLKFPKLSLFNRIRMGVTLALLRFNPVWKPLEKFRAQPYLQKMMGIHGYKTIWEPLMINKLGKYASIVSLAWFWARIYKRTQSLAYPEGGFLEFAQHLENEVKKMGGIFYYDTEVVELSSNTKPQIKYKKTTNYKLRRYEIASTLGVQTTNFDAVIVTLPSPLFTKIAPSLPENYKASLTKQKGIGAVNVVLRLKNEFFNDGTYWLNMCDLDSPILAVVEHTNFMDSKKYNNEHLVYVGNYMDIADPRFSMTKEELLKLYDPWLKKINSKYKSFLIDYSLFKAPFAQPIVPPNYSRLLPQTDTPLKNVYLANIQQVYPWDRGTNYAVELGKNIAEKINENKS